MNALLRFSAATTVALTTATVVTTTAAATVVTATSAATVVTTAAGIAARAAAAGILAALGRAATWAGRSTGRAFTRTAGTGRFAKGATIAIHGRTTTRPITTVVSTRSVSARIAFATVRGGRFFLRPLRAEAEPLKLVQIEFVEIRGRIFFGGVVVHVVRNPAGAGRVLVANWCVAVRNQNAMSAAPLRGGKQFCDGAAMINVDRRTPQDRQS